MSLLLRAKATKQMRYQQISNMNRHETLSFWIHAPPVVRMSRTPFHIHPKQVLKPSSYETPLPIHSTHQTSKNHNHNHPHPQITTHRLSTSLAPTLFATASRVPLIAAAGLPGNCFFNTSIKPTLLRLLP